MAFLLTSCSVYPVEVDTVDQLAGVWSDFDGRTVEFKDDGTFTAQGLDEAGIGAQCSGIAARQHGAVSLSGTYGEVTFDGVDCEGMALAFYGSPSSFVACFTRDPVSGGCTDEFSRKADPGDPGGAPTT
ncbi:hypothetical protein EAO71_14290 [Streptomyces sp. ms191]|uniref:hypothetical protein n=1 Tax=Streptomyces sp. ms191 TaxID=1827978 RepID=UPI0011CD4C80|nr:hypothetical protein [Streptomyces sp. ms191]TXS29787.1 hypothetical protein EAO71_14290 [Streptomyces sp. ms191]